MSYSFPDNRSAVLIFKDYMCSLVFAGIAIVLPSYVLVILPVSVRNYSAAKMGRAFTAKWYFFGILALGLVYAFGTSLTDTAWLSGRRSLFFLPFVVFALVVTASSKRLIPRCEEKASSKKLPLGLVTERE